MVAATAEIIAISLTRNPCRHCGPPGSPSRGIGAAATARQFRRERHPRLVGAKAADPTRDGVLIDVVRELAISADIPMPATYVIEDASQNAFATGRDPTHASIAVTRGLLEHMDREQLQGVVAHELGHVRNLDTRYALYVAVLVGLVALVTDGFLQLVIEGWKQGVFIWKSDDKSVVASLAMGLVGLFLLIVAALLRVFAPLFSALVQAATSREREFLPTPHRSSSPNRRHWSGRSLRSRTTTTRSTARTAGRSTCGSATRSSRAAIVAPGCSRPILARRPDRSTPRSRASTARPRGGGGGRTET